MNNNIQNNKYKLKPIIKYAIQSRLFIWIISLLSHIFVNEHDSSASLILSDNSQSYSTLDQIIIYIFGVFVRWDSFFFYHIAENGYIYEQETAFFPFLPYMMRILSNTILYPLQFILNYKCVLLISGVLIVNLSFILATITLYKLGIKIFNDEKFSKIAAICYCLTPSGMFSTAIYTESLFAFLTFLGMEKMVDKKYFQAALIWMITTLTRSNAITYVGFFGYEMLQSSEFKKIANYIYQLVMRKNTSSHFETINVKRLLKSVLKFIVYSCIVILGLVLFQFYGYKKFCLDVKDENGNFIRPWCENKLPLLYSFVQIEYWNCGFMRYYTINNIPNFFLAIPMITISICGIISYCKYDWHRMLTLGLVNNISRTYYSSYLLPHIILWIFLVLYCCTSMHIQVITRFFSSLPTLYWFVNNNSNSSSSNGRNWGYIILYYFIFYGILGVVLFTAFYPPA
ncbi:mannosyltransferase [Neocallimastix californiae]|uniref:GPI mannosyltransferase 2 n=1 Tax=Neocallimastix californiae TaxID=1754190 RepID=A0A1Y2EGJ3_9FUNG|nr:mannosyltransferase [Neocallimastix californiae]|eukprot:ORY70691.1 mannosyltransferase [Neocallimastix californiae]